MNIQAIILKERAPYKKALDQAKTAHDRKVTESNKAIEAARTKYESEVTKAKSAAAQTEQAVKEAHEQLNDFDSAVTNFQAGTGNLPSKKGAKVKAPVAKKGVKVKAAAPVKTKSSNKTAGSARAIKGRDEVRNGIRPPIKDAIRLILGKQTKRSRDITAELIARKWTPQSGTVSSYVPYVLSLGCKGGDKAIFESVDTGKGRGYYRVRHGAPPMNA
ncbi:MAG: hypothetical protein OK454_06025, partial [Thaumarchaeota archaeon]|nr:hypothetical protein [Nitrososphaerota archaeon]